jgi:hypothetical protein
VGGCALERERSPAPMFLMRKVCGLQTKGLRLPTVRPALARPPRDWFHGKCRRFIHFILQESLTEKWMGTTQQEVCYIVDEVRQPKYNLTAHQLFRAESRRRTAHVHCFLSLRKDSDCWVLAALSSAGETQKEPSAG